MIDGFWAKRLRLFSICVILSSPSLAIEGREQRVTKGFPEPVTNKLGDGIVKATVLRVRTTPNLGSDVVGKLEKGERVSVIQFGEARGMIDGLRDRWVEIQKGGLKGWVFGGYIDVVNTSEMPNFTWVSINGGWGGDLPENTYAMTESYPVGTHFSLLRNPSCLLKAEKSDIPIEDAINGSVMMSMLKDVNCGITDQWYGMAVVEDRVFDFEEIGAWTPTQAESIKLKGLVETSLAETIHEKFFESQGRYGNIGENPTLGAPTRLFKVSPAGKEIIFIGYDFPSLTIEIKNDDVTALNSSRNSCVGIGRIFRFNNRHFMHRNDCQCETDGCYSYFTEVK